MKCYASIDSFENNYAILEVELCEIFESNTLSIDEKKERFVNVHLSAFPDTKEEFFEGDVVIVEYEEGVVLKILGKDEKEKERRINRRRKIEEILDLVD